MQQRYKDDHDMKVRILPPSSNAKEYININSMPLTASTEETLGTGY